MDFAPKSYTAVGILQLPYMLCFLLTQVYGALASVPDLPNRYVWVDYSCIPQPSSTIPLQESLIPAEVSRRGSFFAGFNQVSKLLRKMSKVHVSEEGESSGGGDHQVDYEESKGEPRRANSTDHRHNNKQTEGSLAKHYLGEAVKSIPAYIERR